MQQPPAYSALKLNGRRFSDLMRQEEKRKARLKTQDLAAAVAADSAVEDVDDALQPHSDVASKTAIAGAVPAAAVAPIPRPAPRLVRVDSIDILAFEPPHFRFVRRLCVFTKQETSRLVACLSPSLESSCASVLGASTFLFFFPRFR